MPHRTLLPLVFAVSIPLATAADAEPFEWNDQLFARVAAGDSAAGKKVAKEVRCKRCHNVDGVSDDPEIPTIAGQRATYLYKQLMDYKTGARESEEMRKVARKMDEQQMIDVSAWFSEQERPEMVGGERLLVVEVCDSCHEKEVVEEEGRIEVAPRLSGQVPEYLEANLLAFKDQARSNDLFLRMRSESHKLDASEIRALASYYGAPPLEE
jgi:cytochrome c553